MKRFIALLLALFLVVPPLGGLWGGAAGADPETVFAGQVADMVFGNWEDGFFSTISLTAGQPEMTVDGQTVNIEPPEADGTDVALPILEIAEVIGAEVRVDAQTGQLTVSDDGERKTVTARRGGRSPRVRSQELSDALDLDITVEGNRIFITRPYQTKRLIVYMEPGCELKDSRGAKKTITDGGGLYLLQYDSRRKTRQAEASLRRDPGVEGVWPDCVVKADALGWGTGRVAAGLMTQHLAGQGKDQSELVVAVLDTGIDSAHPLFRGRLKTGFNFTAKNTAPIDRYGHGTHVSGTIADCTPQNVKVMPVKVLDDHGVGSDATITLGIKYAADNGAKVLNMSFSGGEYGYALYGTKPCPTKKAIDHAAAKGAVCVAAAGNDEIPAGYCCPARYDEVVTVAAVDRLDGPAWFSNYGPCVDIAAPGVDVMSALPGGKYAEWSGTSMAAPHVTAGLALLILNGEPVKDAESAKAALRKAIDTPANWNDFGAGFWGDTLLFGEGILDFRKLLGVTAVPADGVCFWTYEYIFDLDAGDASVRQFIDSLETDLGLLSRKNFHMGIDVTPGNASDKTLTVASDDPGVATWDQYTNRLNINGGVGSATLTATTASLTTATFEVVVNPSDCWIDYPENFAGGDGSESNPYLIETSGQLAKLAHDTRTGATDWSGTYFRLENDIDLTGHTWGPIGYTKADKEIGGDLSLPFRGNFDGNYKIIKNMSIPETLFAQEGVNYQFSARDGAGLFHTVENASIQNLGIEDAEVNKYIRGPNEYPFTDSRPRTKGSVLAYSVTGSDIERCYADGLDGGAYFIFRLNNSRVRDCFSADVPIFNNLSGGASLVANCCAPASYFGRSASSGEIINCFSDHHMGDYYSGFFGYSFNGLSEFRGCFTMTRSEGPVNPYFNIRPESWFKNQSNYVDTRRYGWDITGAFWDDEYPWNFTDTWAIGPGYNNGLPYLRGFADPPKNKPRPDGPKPIDTSEYIVRANAPYSDCYIDLSNEFIDLTPVLGGYVDDTGWGYSLDGGRTWKAGKIWTGKLLDKGGSFAFTDRFDSKAKKPTPDAQVIVFPLIQKRPKAPAKLVPNYTLKADPTGRTLGAWVFTNKDGSAPKTEEYELLHPILLEWDLPWYLPLSKFDGEGIPVTPLSVEKSVENELRLVYLRKAAVIDGDVIIPASKSIKYKLKAPAKHGKFKPDYKKEIVKLKAGVRVFGGSLSDLMSADMDNPNTYAASAADFGPGKLYVYRKGDKGVNLSAMLDLTKARDGAAPPVTAAVCIWTSATAKAPASDIQEYTLAVRAGLPDQTIEGASLPKTLEVFSGVKWGSPPKVSETTVLVKGVRLKGTAKANGYDDSAQFAASLPKDLTIEYGAGGVARFIVAAPA